MIRICHLEKEKTNLSLICLHFLNFNPEKTSLTCPFVGGMHKFKN